MEERNVLLDILRGFSIILVVVGHCIQYGSGNVFLNDNLFYNNPIFIFIYSFHMPLFMIISGFLFHNSLLRKTHKQNLVNKFKQLIIPLFCWSLISTIINMAKILIGVSDETITLFWFLKKILSNFIYGPWFLWAIWWCSLIVLFVNKFFKDNIVLYIFGILFTLLIPDVFGLQLYKYMLPFFVISYLFNKHDLLIKLKNVYMNSLFIIFCFSFFTILLIFFNEKNYIYTSGHFIFNDAVGKQLYYNSFRFFIGLFGSLSVVYFFVAIIRFIPNKIKSIFSYLGKNTLGVYIISNYLVIELLSIVTSNLCTINYLLLLVESVIIIIISLVINIILKKIPITNKILLGGREYK